MVRVGLLEAEPVVAAGVTSWLASHSDITVAEQVPASPVDVLVVVDARVDALFLDSLGDTTRRDGTVVVLVLDCLPDDSLEAAVRAGVVRVLPRATTDRDRLVSAVVEARLEQADDEVVLGELELALNDMWSRAWEHPSAILDDRDVELLGLVADGWDTREIARQVSLSHRVVANRLRVVVRKCGARNRCEAVARAARAGLV